MQAESHLGVASLLRQVVPSVALRQISVVVVAWWAPVYRQHHFRQQVVLVLRRAAPLMAPWSISAAAVEASFFTQSTLQF